jgi:hypothetical protein
MKPEMLQNRANVSNLSLVLRAVARKAVKQTSRGIQEGASL